MNMLSFDYAVTVKKIKTKACKTYMYIHTQLKLHSSNKMETVLYIATKEQNSDHLVCYLLSL